MKILKNNKKLILGILIGIVTTGTVVYAANILASDVSYDNTTSGLQATTAQAAIDELTAKASTLVKPKNNTVYFAFGTPTTSSTTDYTTLNKNVFVALNGGQKSVCIIRNNRLHCFDNNNYAIEQQHIQQVFSDVSCNVNSSYVSCSASDFYCQVSSNGYVDCDDNGSREYCYVNTDGSVRCG